MFEHLAILIPYYTSLNNVKSLCSNLISIGFTNIIIITEEQEVLKTTETENRSLSVIYNINKRHPLVYGLEHIKNTFTDIKSVLIVDASYDYHAEDILNVSKSIDSNKKQLVIASPATSNKPKLIDKLVRLSFIAMSSINVKCPRIRLRAITVSALNDLMRNNTCKDILDAGILLRAKRLGIDIKEAKIKKGDSHSYLPVSTFKQLVRIYLLLFAFCMSSFASFLVDISIYVLLITTIFVSNANAILFSTVLARIVSSLVNYLLNKRMVFKDTRRNKMILIKFAFLTITKMFASYAFVFILTDLLGISSAFVKPPVDLLLFFIGFYAQQNWAFLKKQLHS